MMLVPCHDNDDEYPNLSPPLHNACIHTLVYYGCSSVSIGGEIIMKDYSINMSYRQLNNFAGAGKQAMTHAIADNKLQKNDVMLINFGLHYNEYVNYVADIDRFNQELIEIQKMNSNAPSIYFIETFPQHFPLGGYFIQKKLGKIIHIVIVRVSSSSDMRIVLTLHIPLSSSMLIVFSPFSIDDYIQIMLQHRHNKSNHILCQPYSSTEQAVETDWRNLVVHSDVINKDAIVNVSHDMYPYYYRYADTPVLLYRLSLAYYSDNDDDEDDEYTNALLSLLFSLTTTLHCLSPSHVDYGDSLRLDGNISDCTHYCYGSAAMAVVVSHVLSVLIPQGV